MNSAFSVIASISRDEKNKTKNASTEKDDASWLVAGRLKLSNQNEIIVDFMKVVKFHDSHHQLTS